MTFKYKTPIAQSNGQGIDIDVDTMKLRFSPFLYKILNELKPRYVILYDVQVSTIRQLEVFQASHPDHKLKSYIMMYGNSAEEQAYLSSLRKEKQAFEKLLKEKTIC